MRQIHKNLFGLGNLLKEEIILESKWNRMMIKRRRFEREDIQKGKC